MPFPTSNPRQRPFPAGTSVWPSPTANGPLSLQSLSLQSSSSRSWLVLSIVSVAASNVAPHAVAVYPVVARRRGRIRILESSTWMICRRIISRRLLCHKQPSISLLLPWLHLRIGVPRSRDSIPPVAQLRPRLGSRLTRMLCLKCLPGIMLEPDGSKTPARRIWKWNR